LSIEHLSAMNVSVSDSALTEAERLRHVDLDVIDEIAVPDRLEESVCETERENILRRFFAEKMIDPEDLLFVEYLVRGNAQVVQPPAFAIE
jgi:hypothetical protein